MLDSAPKLWDIQHPVPLVLSEPNPVFVPLALDSSVQLPVPIFLYNFKPHHLESDEYSIPMWHVVDTRILEVVSAGFIDIINPLAILLFMGSHSFPSRISILVYVLCFVWTTIPSVNSNFLPT